MIYALQPLDGGPVKIGFSSDVEARQKQLEATYGRPLALLATIEGGREEERAIHDRFAHLRLGGTEQFRPTPELMAFLGRPLLVDQNAKITEAIPAKNLLAIQIRGAPEWKAWVEEMAAFDRLSVAAMTDRALSRYAEMIGFKEPPPKR